MGIVSRVGNLHSILSGHIYERMESKLRMTSSEKKYYIQLRDKFSQSLVINVNASIKFLYMIF